MIKVRRMVSFDNFMYKLWFVFVFAFVLFIDPTNEKEKVEETQPERLGFSTYVACRPLWEV